MDVVKSVLSFLKVFWFFKSFKKAYLWFTLPNPLLGGIKPVTMIKLGRSKKLYKYITQQLEENKPPKGYKK